MTAQIQDSFLFEPAQSPFAVVGVSGEDLFDPKGYGLNPVAMHTACYRGWYATYALRAGQLVLSKFAVGLDRKAQLLERRGRVVELAGVAPRKDPGSPGEWLYDNLDLPLSYAGGLLVGRGFLRELYVHMGFHPAWKFSEVIELVFDRGQLVSQIDRSKEMADVRSRLKDTAPLGKQPSREEIQAWIEASFSLKY
jgi:hypothetical protein